MENNHYNINLNPKPLSSEEIAKHKDFDGLLEQFNATPPPKKPSGIKPLYYIIGTIAAGLLGAILYFGAAGQEQAMTTSEYLASQPYINPPFEHIQQEFALGQVNADQGGVYLHDNGSKVIIPPAAFVDANGQSVKGAVDIKYREFHDFIDFYLSGIPMEYDSSGQTYFLESSGMVEVYAEQNGERLEIAPDKQLDIELISEIKVPASDRASIPQFNVYQLDEEKRNWVYQGQDNIEVLEEDMSDLLAEEDSPEAVAEAAYQEELANITSQEARELAAIEATIPRPLAPVKPERANGNDYVFNFDFAEQDIRFSSRARPGAAEREMDQNQDAINQLRKQYANTMWQLAPNNSTDFNQEMLAQINWEDMSIERINNRDYELTLMNPNKTVKLLVNPVLQGEDYEEALKVFNADYAKFQSELAAREAQLEEQKKALAERIRTEKELANKSFREKIDYLKKQGKDNIASEVMIQQKIVNRFAVSELGVWNCDRPLPPFIYNLSGEFVENQSQQQYKHNTAFLVDKNKNTFCRYYNSEKATVRFDGRSDNMMWMVTPENKVAIYRPEQFKDINKREGEYTFVMDVIDRKIEKEEDLREILQF